jgi:hypothetical protein
MENKTINLKTIALVAEALKELKDEMVFVGGAVISLYTDDPAADEIRPTGDIDLTIQLSGYNEWVKLNERLLTLGFSPNPEGHAICNYLYKNIEIDIMPVEDSAIGKTNSWYKPGLNYIQKVNVETQEIQILKAPYFLATKFEAYSNRGKDYRLSHDFEDIIYLIDNRINVVEEILNSDNKVQQFLISEFKKVMANPNHIEIISSQIHPLMNAERSPIVIEKIQKIIHTKA